MFIQLTVQCFVTYLLIGLFDVAVCVYNNNNPTFISIGFYEAFLFAYSSITKCSLNDKLDLNFFGCCFINTLILLSKRYCMVLFCWGPFFNIFDFKGLLLPWLIYSCDTGFIFEVDLKFNYSKETLWIQKQLIFNKSF